MNLKPILRNISKTTGQGTVTIYLDFYNRNHREQLFFKTPIKVEKKQFHKGKIRMHPNSEELNTLLNLELQQVYSLINELKVKDVDVTAENIKSYKAIQREGEKDLVTLCREYVLFRTDMKLRMKQKLENLITRIDDFTKGKKVFYSQINQVWINEFTQYLQTEQPKHPNPNLRLAQQPNTVHKTFAFFKQILHHYARLDVIDDKFKNLKYPKEFTQKQMVFEKDEIRKLIEYKPNRDSLKRVKDLALVQLFTGLRYSDAIKINESNIQNNSLIIRTVKTSQNISIPLHKSLKQILEKYDYNLLTLSISNQRYNEHLKSLIELAGIDSKAEYIRFKDGVQSTEQVYKYNLVGSHTFRRTFITNAIIEGVPLHVIQGITGHTTLKQLSEYVNIADSIKQQEMAKMDALFAM